jgi:hypothetical protein
VCFPVESWDGRTRAALRFQKGQQVLVDLVLVCHAQAMRSALVGESMSRPVHGWLERPWPRRSWAIQRNRCLETSFVAAEVDTSQRRGICRNHDTCREKLSNGRNPWAGQEFGTEGEIRFAMSHRNAICRRGTRYVATGVSPVPCDEKCLAGRAREMKEGAFINPMNVPSVVGATGFEPATS